MRHIIRFFALLCIQFGTGFAETKFEPHQVVRPFKAITDAPHVGTERAADFVKDDELVLGVKIGKASRAYPINMLTSPHREIINDKLGGKNIAATW